MEVDEELSNISGDLINLTKTASNINGISIYTDETKNLKESEKQYKSLVQYLGELSDIWDELSETQQNNLLQKLFGKTRSNAGAAIITNFDAVRDALEAMDNAAGSADREMSKIKDSMEYKINALTETWTETFQRLMSRDEVKSFIDKLTLSSEKFGDALVDLAPSIEMIVSSLLDLVNVLSSFTSILGGNGTLYTIIGGLLTKNGQGFNIKSSDNIFKGDEFSLFGNSLNSVAEQGFTNYIKRLFEKYEYTEEDISRLVSEFNQLFEANDNTSNGLKELLSSDDFNVLDLSSEIYDYVNATDEASISSENFREALKNVKSQSAATAAGFKVLKAVGSTLANAFMSWGISMAIQLALKGISWLIDNVVNYSEKLIEKSNKITDEIDDLNSALDTNKAKVKDLSSRYEELSKGVDKNGRNINLSTEEYEEFQEILSKIIQTTPSLLKGYENGNILIEDKNSLLQDSINLLDEQYYKELRNSTTESKNKDYFKGKNEELNNISKESNVFDESLLIESELKNVLLSYKKDNNIINDYDVVEDIIKNVFGGDLLLPNIGETWIDTLFSNYAQYSDENYYKIYQYLKSNESKYELGNKLDGYFVDYFSHIDETNKKKEEVYNDLRDNLYVNAQTSFSMNEDGSLTSDFLKLSQESDNFIKDYIDSIDFTDVTEAQYLEYVNTVRNLVNKISNSDEAQGIINALYNIDSSDITVGEYEKQINNVILQLATLFPEYKIPIKMTLQPFIQTDDVSNQKQILLNEYSSKMSGNGAMAAINSLTYEDLGIAALITQENAVKGITLSWQELIKAIEEYKSIPKDNDTKTIWYSEENLKKVDDFQTKMSTLGTAMEKIKNGTWTDQDSIDLLQDFPALRDESGNLENAINNLIDNSLKSLLELLGEDVPKEFKNGLIEIADSAKQINIPELSSQLDLIQTKASSLKDIMDNYNSTGKITIDQFQTLMENSSEYIDYLMTENGELELNSQALVDVANAKVELMKQTLINDMVNEITSIEDESEALEFLSKHNLEAAATTLVLNEALINTWSSQAIKSGKIASSTVEKIEDYFQSFFNTVSNLRVDYGDLFGTNQVEKAAKGFNNAKDKYEQLVNVIDSNVNLIQSSIDMLAEKGHTIGQAFYDELININKIKKSTYEQQLEELTSEMANAVANGVKEGSEEWLEMNASIYETKDAIIGVMKEIESLQNTIDELHWTEFENTTEEFDRLQTQIGNVIDLLDTDDVLDDDTMAWTKDAITAMGLYAEQMETSEYTARKYRAEMQYQYEQYQSGAITLEEFREKLKTLTDGEWEATKSYKAAKDAMVELQKKGIEEQIEALEELYEARKKAWEEEKDAYEWEKKVTEHNKSESELQAQISALEADTSLAGIKKRKELEDELADLQSDWEDTMYDHVYDEREKELDEELDNKKTALEDSLKDVEAVVQRSIELVNQNTTAIFENLVEVSGKYGIEIDDNIVAPFRDGGNAVSEYDGVFGNMSSNMTGKLNGIQMTIKSVQDTANLAAKDIVSMLGVEETTLITTLDTLKTRIEEVQRLASQGYDDPGSIDPPEKKLQKITYDVIDNSTGWTYDDGFENRSDAEEAAKKYKNASVVPKVGYATGTQSATQGWHPTYEKGVETIIDSNGHMLIPYSGGESVFNNSQTKALWEMSSNPIDFIKKTIGKFSLPETGSIATQNVNVTQHYDSLITVEGDMTPDVLAQITNDNSIIRKIKDIAMQGTVEAIGTRGFKFS